MNTKTPAIVLHIARVSDRASILHLYTREHGRVSYYVYGAKRTSQIFLPLTIVDIDAVHLENRPVQQLKDTQVQYVATATHTDIRRQTVALFIAEILYRTLTHPLPDPALFDYLTEAVQALDQRPDPENVHLEFLVGFVGFLGFGIDSTSALGQMLIPLHEGAIISRFQRKNLLRALMDYYQQNVPDFVIPKSLDVMTEVFS